MSIEVARWGKDHWSVLAYVETRCVDGRDGVGELDHRNLSRKGGHAWKPEYCTRLKGNGDGTIHHAEDHDDWDCLDDLEAAGLVDVHSAVNGLVTMTDLGMEIAGSLRAWKAAGGNYAEFSHETDAPRHVDVESARTTDGGTRLRDRRPSA